jgi:beta-phosphoglucomutase family hydrolase
MPQPTFKAVLWDMDGVIADTWLYHFSAWQDVFPKRGYTFTKEEFMRHFGQRADTIIRYVMGKNIPQDEANIVLKEKEEAYRRRVVNNIKPLPGALELIQLIHNQGIKMAIASSAPIENITIIINRLGVSKYIQAIASGKEVNEGKPSPEIYLLAAKKLGIAPADCIVFEDAVAGVAGAKKAGMKCVAVTNSHPRNSLGEADLIVDSLEELSINKLAGLFLAGSK